MRGLERGDCAVLQDREYLQSGASAHHLGGVLIGGKFLAAYEPAASEKLS
jgi:hypothetical protein